MYSMDWGCSPKKQCPPGDLRRLGDLDPWTFSPSSILGEPASGPQGVFCIDFSTCFACSIGLPSRSFEIETQQTMGLIWIEENQPYAALVHRGKPSWNWNVIICYQRWSRHNDIRYIYTYIYTWYIRKIWSMIFIYIYVYIIGLSRCIFF